MKHAWSTSFTKSNGNANLISFSCHKANIIRFLIPANVRTYGIGLIHLGAGSISNRYLWWCNAMALSNRLHYHLIWFSDSFMMCQHRQRIHFACFASPTIQYVVAHHKNGITALSLTFEHAFIVDRRIS